MGVIGAEASLKFVKERRPSPTRQGNLEIDNSAMAISLVASTRGVTLLPASAENFLKWPVISRPLKGEGPTIDLVAEYHKTKQRDQSRPESYSRRRASRADAAGRCARLPDSCRATIEIFLESGLAKLHSGRASGVSGLRWKRQVCQPFAPDLPEISLASCGTLGCGGPLPLPHLAQVELQSVCLGGR